MKYTKIEDVKEDVIKLYKEGKMKKEIQDILNVSEFSITKFFKENIVYKFNEDCFESIDSEEKAYWLGFIWADGSITKYSLDIEITDLEHIEKFKEFLNTSTEHKIRNRKKSICYRLTVSSKKLISDLKNLGYDVKDNRVVIPNLQEDLLRHFIRGYFDGDGHIRIDKTFEGVDISGRIQFIDNLNKYLNFGREELHSKCSKRIYSLKDKGYEFLRFIYDNCTIYLDRKYTSALSIRNS